MDENKITEQCKSFTNQEAACFTTSCFGMLSFAGDNFLAWYQDEILSIWNERNLPLDENLFSIGFEKLEQGLKNSASYESDVFLREHYSNSYLNGDDGSFDSIVGFFINIPTDLATIANSLLSGADIKKTVGLLDRKIFGACLSMMAVRAILCYALFNDSEPGNPEDQQEFDSSPCLVQAERDLQYAIELAKREKIIPRGERKWDYEFLGYPSGGPKVS